jgi:hypothetical protein
MVYFYTKTTNVGNRYILEGLSLKNFYNQLVNMCTYVLCGHFLYLITDWYILWSFDIFSPSQQIALRVFYNKNISPMFKNELAYYVLCM